MGEKLNSTKKADILILRAVGYSTREIAEKLGVSQQLVSYHLTKVKKRAEETNPLWAFMEVLMKAGPGYPLISTLTTLRRGKK